MMKIVLDMDDTLYLEQNYVRSGYKAIDSWLSNKHGKTGFFDLAWPLFKTGANDVFQTILVQMKMKPCLVSPMVEIYRGHVPQISLEDDARDFLSAYHKDFELFMITDGDLKRQKAKIDALGIEKHFSKIIITGQYGVEFFKPNERSFKEIQGVSEAGECIYIGDNPKKDFIAPSALGWLPSIRMQRPGSLHESLETPIGVREFRSFNEISREVILNATLAPL